MRELPRWRPYWSVGGHAVPFAGWRWPPGAIGWFRQPATVTATLGRSVLVIEVAIALAVSWKPLVKSKTSAVSTPDDDDRRYVRVPCPSLAYGNMSVEVGISG